METRQLEYFLTLAREEHVSSAASILNISQPALSKSLAKLEDEVGTKLFDRRGNSIHLNDHGRNFAKYAQECLETLNTGLATTRQGRYDILGEITILSHAVLDALTDCIMSYTELNPYIKFNLLTTEDDFDNLTGGYDFIWGSNQDPLLLSEQNSIWAPETMMEEPLGIIVSPKLIDYPPETTVVSLADFQDIPFINAPKITLFYSDITTKLCLAAGFAPKIYCSTYDFTVCAHMVKAGKAAAILHETSMRAAQELSPDIRAYRIAEKPVSRTLYLIHRDRTLMSEAALDFLDFAIDYFHPPVTDQG